MTPQVAAGLTGGDVQLLFIAAGLILIAALFASADSAISEVMPDFSWWIRSPIAVYSGSSAFSPTCSWAAISTRTGPQPGASRSRYSSETSVRWLR